MAYRNNRGGRGGFGGRGGGGKQPQNTGRYVADNSNQYQVFNSYFLTKVFIPFSLKDTVKRL